MGLGFLDYFQEVAARIHVKTIPFTNLTESLRSRVSVNLLFGLEYMQVENLGFLASLQTSSNDIDLAPQLIETPFIVMSIRGPLFYPIPGSRR